MLKQGRLAASRHKNEKPGTLECEDALCFAKNRLGLPIRTTKQQGACSERPRPANGAVRAHSETGLIRALLARTRLGEV